MCLARAVKDRLGLGRAIRLPDLLHVQYSQHDTFGITQRNFAAAGRQLPGKFFCDVQA